MPELGAVSLLQRPCASLSVTQVVGGPLSISNQHSACPVISVSVDAKAWRACDCSWAMGPSGSVSAETGNGPVWLVEGGC